MRSGPFLMAVMVLSGAVHGAESMDHFAYGITLTLEGNQLYEFEVPDHMYRLLQQHNLKDIRVFDAKGNEMAQTTTEPMRRIQSKSQQTKNLTFFPVTQLPLGTAQDFWNQQNMRIKRDATGIIVDIYNDSKVTNTKSPAYYIADLGGISNKNLSYVDLFWKSSEQVTSTVTVETSNDLKTWQHAGGGVIFSLRNGRQKFYRNRVDVTRMLRYLKLTLQPASTPVLTGIHAIFENRVEQPTPFQWTKATLITQDRNSFEYNVPFGYPYFAFRVVPESANVLQHIQVSRSNDGKNWQRIYDGNVYRLKVGNKQYVSDTIPYPVNIRWTHWRVDIISSNQPQNDAPRLEIGWFPQKIKFLTSEAGLYTVAFGSSSVQQQAPSIPATINKNQPEVKPIVMPDTVIEIGGTDAIQKLPDSTAIKKTILWIVMALVLVVMGIMVYRLVKTMNVPDA